MQHTFFVLFQFKPETTDTTYNKMSMDVLNDWFIWAHVCTNSGWQGGRGGGVTH